MSKKIKIWLSTLISAGASAMLVPMSATIVSPAEFNLTSMAGVKNLFLISLISGMVAILNVLKQSPLPGKTSKNKED